MFANCYLQLYIFLALLLNHKNYILKKKFNLFNFQCENLYLRKVVHIAESQHHVTNVHIQLLLLLKFISKFSAVINFTGMIKRNSFLFHSIRQNMQMQLFSVRIF